MEGKTFALEKACTFLQVDKIFLTLCLMIILPWIVHVIPNSGDEPLGAVLLPIFYAPLFAVLCFRIHVALCASLLTPAINHFLFGRPTTEMAIVLTWELMLFVLLAKILSLREKTFLLAGVLSYVLTKTFSMRIASGAYDLGQTLERAIPGMFMFLLINICAVYYLKEMKNHGSSGF